MDYLGELNMSDTYWTKHPHNHKYEQIIFGAHICLVRTQPMPKGYLWQVNKFYGYCPTLEVAKLEAEEMLAIDLMGE